MMSRPRRLLPFLLALAILVPRRAATIARTRRTRSRAAIASRVYGEWRIQVRPDQGPAYNRLIEQSGLPLFRGAGGRMVGWWNTLVGDLYEHVTIWEYDDMAAFERAIGILSKDPAFARFVAARDPLLAGEESRFLRLAPGALPPALPDPAPFVVHEVHRVPLARRDAYLAFMTGQGLGLLKAHGFRPVGPWVVELGRWTEVTYLFRFDSLAERERLIARFVRDRRRAGPTARRSREFAEDVTTRLLIPAPFAKPAAARPAPTAGRAAASRGARPGRLRGRIRRQAPLGELRLGRAGDGDPADRRAPRHPGARVPGDGRRDHRQARADAGADPRPGGRRGDRAGPPRTGDRPRGGLARDAGPAARGARRPRSLDR